MISASDSLAENICRFTTGVDNRMREVVLEEKKTAEELSYLRTDKQKLSEMGPQFECLADPCDINFDETCWKNRLSN